ncbi:UPF0182 family membrane protein [Janibacter hoylei]|uniref:UPF0182 family membrane protein n=1 Tax=Janibacter hoylei TaxID=364298 RepID=UPI0021A75858|nr:UPF0182 family protein [Janibacter hoylei]MCT1619623.1 UPF0182 family protein [Janibacter hoylei]MCT2291606.1 UPF0182 family protein [Janibacter hoylei]
MSSASWPDDEGGAPPPRDEGPPSRRVPRGRVGKVAFVVAAVLLLLSLAASLWTESLWFSSLGYSDMWWTRLRTQVLLFVLGGLITALPIGLSLWLAHRTRPMSVPMTPGEQALAQYRRAIEPFRKVAAIALPAVLGVLGGLAAAGQWQTWLLWRNGSSTGTTDAEFGRDISYYLFALPWWSFVVGFLTVAALGALFAAVFTHYVYGGIVPPGRGRSTRVAFLHLAVIAAVLALLRAWSYVLSAHALTTQENEVLTGVGYTGAHALVPTKYILAVAAAMCAGLFLASVRSRSWRLPLIAVATLVVLSVVVGSIYPALVETYKVSPSRNSLEEPYLQRNIDATRAAHGVTGVKTDSYDAVSDVESGQLREDAASIPGIRLLDPAVVSTAYQELQAQQPYYTFQDELDVDRYDIEGETVDVVVGARELDLDKVPADRRDWVNDHTVYTHGYGLVMARGTQARAGNPQWITPEDELGEYEPRIYFGEEMDHFSIVGQGDTTTPREIDQPTGGEESRYTYQGEGGVAIGSRMRQAAYAVTHRDLKFLLSDAVGSDSRLLEHRTPSERVRRVAPWLTLDDDVYPTVVDGRIQWVVDGYTTSQNYPYSTAFSMSGVQSGQVSSVQTQQASSLVGDRINYMRNSVKATVDAYDGTVKLYTWDESDPIVSAWDKAFPGLLTPKEEISGDLMSHLRYPEDLFRMQRAVLADYHVTSAADFRAGQDRWRVPDDPSRGNDGVAQPPYFLSLAMPDQEQPAWSLTSTYIPRGTRNVMAGYLAVDADAGSVKGTPASDYGQLRLLSVPRNTTVPGVGQVQNDIVSSNATSGDGSQTLTDYLNNANRGGSQVSYGNQLALPVGEGFLHVEPIYLSSASGTSYPQLRIVIVTFGGKVAWAQDLETALDELFGGDAGVTAEGKPSGEPTKKPEEPDEPKNLSADDKKLRQAIAGMQKAYKDGQDALKKGDFAAYDEAQKELKKQLEEAAKVQPGGGSADLDAG